MKFFIDTANVSEIREMAWLIDGVTTNPSLVAREKRPFEQVIAEICDIVDGPVSAEATALDAEGMIEQGKELSQIHENVVIKIPMTEEGMKAVVGLSEAGIRTNVTLVFSPNQALVAAKCGAAFVSPFVGRIDDVGGDGMDLVSQILDIYDQYAFETEVIVASVRHPQHVLDAALLGAEIATVPYKILKKLFDHPLTDVGIDRFLKDWEGVPK
ncbi:fructose-6-phosphate aldolase [Candidatus Bipolaricaulota bacterium]|jgi:transaldolase|nr:fructose-6-phosphate aldolase [Candidatus Bipolaricaulota bacterium]